jgi:hypothetical protein
VRTRFRCIMADPPWSQLGQLPGPTRGAARQCAVLSTATILRFPLPPIADQAVLYLWRLASMQHIAPPEASRCRVPLRLGGRPQPQEELRSRASRCHRRATSRTSSWSTHAAPAAGGTSGRDAASGH